ncbi:pilus assembly protein [bacterium]|nr:pilus assembly protein [candidate division CSSED10-310 bacterium]
MRRRRRLGEDGQAMVEFALTFPILLALVTAILEFALMYNAKAMVNYAAFNGARCAAVYVPRDYEIFGFPFSDPNEVDWWKKYFKIHLSIALSMAPISPEGLDIASHIPIIGPFIALINDVFESMPGFLRDMLNGVDRLLYAYAATAGLGCDGVSITDDLGEDYGTGQHLRSGRDGGDIVIKVNYVYHLQIPVFNRLLGWWWFPSRRHLWSWIFLGEETFWNIRGRCSIPNEPHVNHSQQSEYPWY